MYCTDFDLIHVTQTVQHGEQYGIWESVYYNAQTKYNPFRLDCTELCCNVNIKASRIKNVILKVEYKDYLKQIFKVKVY